MTAIAFSSTIGPVPIDCILSEKHTSEIEITANPIETGAEVNDHAYVKPKKVTLDAADESAAAAYNALVAFQESRVPFYLVTGLTVYPNMLIKMITADRDKTYSNVLRASVDLQEVIIVSTATASVDVGDTGGTPSGQPGGEKSTSSASPSKARSGDAVTGDRATGTVQRGDARAKTVSPAKNQSLLKQITG
jgi:hypothetical protein